MVALSIVMVTNVVAHLCRSSRHGSKLAGLTSTPVILPDYPNWDPRFGIIHPGGDNKLWAFLMLVGWS